MADRRDKTLGLKAIEQSAEARNKRVRPPLRVAVWFGLIVAVATVLRWRCTLSEMDEDRTKLMAKQRTVEAELGPKWYPLRDKLEKWANETAALPPSNGPGDEVVDEGELAAFDFRSKPGLYFRARVDEAKTPKDVREAAKRSLRDGFTSCLMRGAEASPVKGKECQKTRDCERGEFCNELNHCGPPTQPYNMRAAYKTLNILSEEWIADVQETTNDLRLELLIRSFEDSTADDLPLAADLLTRASYFLVVLDERPPTRPLSPEEIDAGKNDADDVDALDGKTYPARVALYRIADGKLLMRVRREPNAELIGGASPGDSRVAAARTRQAQSCGLGLEIRKVLGDTVPTAIPNLDEPPSPAPTTSASAGAAPSASAAPTVSATPSASAAPTAGASATPR